MARLIESTRVPAGNSRGTGAVGWMSKTVDHIAYKVMLISAAQVVVDPSESYKDQGFFLASQIDCEEKNSRYADHEEPTGLDTGDTACGKRP